MSWMAKLYETYESVALNCELAKDLEPYYHKREPCHIEIVLDDRGNFIRAESLLRQVSYGKNKFWKGEDSIIPITPKSLTGRTRGAAPYPLAEQIQYVAKDYPNFGGVKASYFHEYFELLKAWAESTSFSHFKVVAIAEYVAHGHVVRDLLGCGLLYGYEDHGNIQLVNKWAIQGTVSPETGKIIPKPPLFNAVSGGEQGNTKIRWRVQRAGDPNDGICGDRELVDKWQGFQEEINEVNGLCQVLGEKKFLSTKHSKGIVPKANDAKLVSAPSNSSYLTYQGRFTNVDQPCGISFEVSQKSHNVLRWVIERQGSRNAEQVYVSWAISGRKIPQPIASFRDLFNAEPTLQKEDSSNEEHSLDYGIDLGNSFADKLKKYMKGYRITLEANEQIIIMGLDSATTGRMGIIYYRELLASEFLDRLHAWHSDFAWPQRYTTEVPDPKGKKKPKKQTIWPVSSPVPRIIAETAYGTVLKSNDTLKKSVIERIVPCIVDGRPFPRDIMVSAVQRASNRATKRLSGQYSNIESEKAAWEKHLGVACALYRGYYGRHPRTSKRREYNMALEEDRTTRDYLYGRLLAVAERIEEVALGVGGESRPTNAARLMQRFADRPYSTWRNLELGLQPYMQRLQGTRAGFLINSKKELDAIQSAFTVDDFTSDKALSGEFLLGYHCQKQGRPNNTSINAESK